MPVTADLAKNLAFAAQEVANAAQRGAQMVLLPEMFCCPYDNRCFPQYAQPVGGAIWQTLQHMAQENHVYLVGGSMPELEEGRIYNTSFVFGPDGRQLARHRKVHLFDINVAGGQRFMESDILSPGEDLTVFDTEYGRFGLCICFDIRFPQMARQMAEAGARCILVPAAFNMTTGPLHWELLFRARAVDQELFTVGCAPARDTNASYVSYGHSIAVSPWGKVVYQADAAPCTGEVTLDFGQVDAVRQQIPVLT
jgi:predicted amidohydrolase